MATSDLNHERNLLRCIPSSGAIRRRLRSLLLEVRQLKVLLRTATNLERAQRENNRKEPPHGS